MVSIDFQICYKNLCIQLFILIFSEKWPSIGLLDSHLAKSLAQDIISFANEIELNKH